MARLSNVMTSNNSRDSSPDPLTLPSSPPAAHLPLARRKRASTKPTRSPSPRKPVDVRATPSKSMVLDTPAIRDGSPWRIRVTVDAEPQESSPGRGVSTRTTTIPLNVPSSTKRTTTSPVNRALANKADGGAQSKRPVRKRKGTPIREKRPLRPWPQPEYNHTSAEDTPVAPPSGTPARSLSGRRSRHQFVRDPNESKRLSVAKKELDRALQDAVGYSDGAHRSDMPGDRTVSMNEDFSIVSLDSLQTAKEASLPNIMPTIPDEEPSVVHASHQPPFPLKAQYPDIRTDAARARLNAANAYDPMSWKPATPAEQKTSQLSHSTHGQQRLGNEAQWQQDHDLISLRVQNADPARVIVAEQDERNGVHDEEDNQRDVHAQSGDIWREQGSHSIHGAKADGRSPNLFHRPIDAPERSRQFEDLFADQPQKPPRSKIPRTWRRSSGMDFSYNDSPAHELAPEEVQERRNSTDGSGVLTPPSTEEEAGDVNPEEPQDEDMESEFEPDAEATRYNDEDPEGEVSDAEDSESDDSGDDDDTGNFFTNNMPQVFRNNQTRRRPERRGTMSLTELLNLDGVTSPEKTAGAGTGADRSEVSQVRRPSKSPKKRHAPQRISPYDSKVKTKVHEGSEDDKIVSSPLRKSLLRSSKMHGDLIETGEPPARRISRPQRQYLLRNAPRRSRTHSTSSEADDGADHGVTSQDIPDSDSEESIREQDGEQIADHSRSYEEHLNVDSPTKIRVNFNDSQSVPSLLHPQKGPVLPSLDPHGNSSLLAPRKRYPPLFAPAQQPPGHRSPLDDISSPDTITLVARSPPSKPSTQPGPFSRLTSSFWSAVIRPTGPTEILPRPSPVSFPHDLRLRVRSRYGLLSSSFPWTMAHMRTLHRMLNSLVSNRSDSLIPRSGPLPLHLSSPLGTTFSTIGGGSFLYTSDHAYVLFTFTQILVSPSALLSASARSTACLGDATAQSHRAYFQNDTRHGSDLVWRKGACPDEIVTFLDALAPDGAEISTEFLLRALGDCVRDNEKMVEKHGKPFVELQRLGLA